MVFLRLPFAHEQEPHLVFGSVLLRPPVMADFEEWVELRQQSREFLELWEPLWSEHEFSRFGFRARVKHYQKLIKNDEGYPFFIFHHQHGHLLGAITANNLRRGVAQMCSVGYWIGAAHANQGYMSQALAAVTEFAFGQLALHRVEAACLPANDASIALLRKSGFQHEGLARNYLKIAGTWQDHLLFSKLTQRAA